MKLLISFPAFQLQACVRDSHTTSVGGDCPSTLRFPAGPQELRLGEENGFMKVCGSGVGRGWKEGSLGKSTDYS